MDFWSPQPYFVDKSKVVKHFLRNRHKIIMISAPQGFLKSTNMRLIASFLDGLSYEAVIERRKALWNEIGLRIMKEIDVVNEFFGQWPYIYLSFSLSGSTCNIDSMVAVIRELYKRHKILLSSDRLSPTQKFNFKIYQNFSYGEDCRGTGERKLADSLAVLCDILCTHHEKSVYVFIDNYDFPLLESLAKGKPMANVQPFLSKMISSLYHSKAVKTVLLNSIGSYTAALEDIHVKVYRFLHGHKFCKYYGFIEDDIMRLVNKNRCSYEITKHILGQYYLTINAKSRVYSPEWLLNFLKHYAIENSVWFENILHKTVMTTVSMRQKLAPLEQGKVLKAKVLQLSTHSDLLQLNRLLNGNIDDLENDEVELVIKLLFDFGMFTPVEVNSASFSLSCNCSSQDSIKLRLIETSRMATKLKPVSS